MKPEVRKYLNAIQFLQDSYQFRKSKNPNFSYEVWAREMKISDKSYVRSMVMGNRGLSVEFIKAFANSLKMDSQDAEYFNYLVQYNQSFTEEQKSLFRKKLVELLQNEFEQFELQAQYDFLSNPLMPKLQVLLTMTDIDSSPSSLAQVLKTTAAEIQTCLRKLESMQLIRKTESGYIAFEKNFNIPDGFSDLGLEAFYMQSFEAAKNSIAHPKEDRRFKSFFVPMNKKEFEKFLVNMQSFVKEQLATFETDTYADRRLYQINMNVMAVSEVQEKEKPQDFSRDFS